MSHCQSYQRPVFAQRKWWCEYGWCEYGSDDVNMVEGSPLLWASSGKPNDKKK